MNNNWHKKSVNEIFEEFGVGFDGLDDDEVRARRKQYGENKIPQKISKSFFIVVLQQFTSPLMIVLIMAMGASIVVGEIGDAIVIVLAILINGVVGFVQEWKAERAAKALQSYEIPLALVRRHGTVMEIDAAELVPGDIVLLAAGSRVPADIRVLKSVELQVDESLLTGESYPVRKQIEKLVDGFSVADRTNMTYLGTLIASGRGEGVVVATGLKTQLGDIAKLVTETKDEKTPLQRQIQRFGWQLGVLFVIVVSVTFVIGIVNGFSVHEMLGIAIALAVASIPEGLLVAMTVVLAIGMQKMLKRRALVRRLVAAETLGGVSVVCTDKTGSITEGKMSIGHIVTAEHDLEMDATMPDDIVEMLRLGALNNDAEVSDGQRVGHPTELALVDAAILVGVNVARERASNKRVGEIPFSAESKFMVTAHKGTTDFFIVKGAPERVIGMCKMSKKVEARFEGAIKKMVEDGLRVLMIATKEGGFKSDKDVKGLECLGIVGISDPLRSTTKKTIKELNSAGVRVVVITGDHPVTAKAVALKAGIVIPDGGVVTGEDLDLIDDNELERRVQNIVIYARVNPRHKVRIVKAWRAKGEVVAMVGDGVNDAAAMKAADIGVALGSGTDVAKQTSDLVLLDDNLASITAAVREGRVIFDNIRKIIVYLMSDSFSEIILIAGAIMIGLPLPLLAVQILWINLVTDGFPNLALTVEPAEADVMQRPPRKKNEPVVNGEMKMLIFIIGIVTDIGLLALFMILLGNGYDIVHLRTVMFTALAIDSLFYVFSVRSLRHSIFRIKLFQNKWLNIAVLAGLAVQIAAVYVPSLQSLFSTIALSGTDWLVLIGLSLFKLVVIEITKEIFIVMKNRKNVASA